MTVNNYFICKYCGEDVASSIEGLYEHQNACIKRTDRPDQRILTHRTTRLKFDIKDFIRV